ncbi:hypothetical protein MTO98_23995 [Mucilaginibacter sp. SMC90]|uniref:hypothetical protein n=1 Tax=Mucilaginibacter sp. SMC90 TaxID=2929803 RepID=UPI001FB514AD|nr:hypothetical protein [Mucilaginibacter sp. SMC90]UOE47474.1 hypothetical protein MTO98_23995 [Mucilaginibacter sp. SMC90]
MLCNPVKKYPGFDKIEIIAELETPARRQAALRVVGESRVENERYLKRFVPSALYAPTSMLIRKMSGSSLAVSFYGNARLTYGLQYLLQLDQLQYVMGSLGAQLTVIEPNVSQLGPALNIGDCGLNLHFYFDPADLVADRFRIYPNSSCDPDTNFGEGNNTIRLADYIIGSFYKVAFSHMGTSQNAGSRHPLLQYA